MVCEASNPSNQEGKKMKKLLKVYFAILFLVSCAWGHAFALPVVDGAINAGEYTSTFSEDTPDGVYYLAPGYGGQAYDAEFLGLFATSERLYFGLQTGIELEPGQAATSGNQQPGDIALDFDNDNSFDWAIRFWSSGFSVINVSAWDNVYYSQHSASNPWRADSGTVVDETSYTHDIVYNSAARDAHGNDLDSNILEGWVSASAFGLTEFGEDFFVEANWTMQCGNDFANVTSTGVAPVPEPATLLMLSAGLIGLAGYGRRKRK